MKHTLLFLLLSNFLFSQTNFPNFLAGTWKIENEESYEHWDMLNGNTLKGFSYQNKNEQIKILEYTEIKKNKTGTFFMATVIGQNNGSETSFKLSKSDSMFVFENPAHDFPKKIVYQKLSDNELFVQISDGKKKTFGYKMKKIVSAIAQPNADTNTLNKNYDADLAKKLGGDDYGMKNFILVILKTGTNNTTDKTLLDKSFKGHMDNINNLVKEGKMIVAGPISKNEKTYRGIFILNVTSFSEAEKLLEQDLAIKENILAYELYKWYGSAALPEYLKYSDKIWKINH